ncbi:branched-chain amino acid transport system II carrier protein [Shewanella avicenniae]|uniref:Branched-chain amino acid transport system carrier protein n=1 Tax=Shewanella avicenniae TaxID=2814294 RepID=A0ABX7QU45_9GAMM|nr:branched-chain amino acid transport system II carrier protein [Shewanella avicenniae]QSX34440.1 branched-chain amino acid transport system II carrier protein [Shewanella avicenniae]
MQNKQLTAGDIIGLGFMAFAFFLGAGNLIFPPFAGYQAGENTPFAMLGFLITAVGLPLAGLIAVAKSKGKVMRMLPPVAATVLASAIYIIIGPAFAAPRTSLVAFEIGLKPFIDNTDTIIHLGGLALNQAQLLFTIVFFIVVMLLSAFPGRLMDSVGKVLTPLLIALLVGLAISVMLFASGNMPAATGDYALHPLSKGIVEGYNTMDTLASLMFGMLIIDLLRKKGIEDTHLQTVYLTKAAFIAAAGLAFVYISLFYLGATAGELASGATNGGQILTNYVNQQFGDLGNIALAVVVSLACLTTAVGLVTSCSDYFSELFPVLSYRVLVVVLSVVCAVVANVGLSELISISIPVLMMVYPVAIALVLVTFLERFFRRPKLTHRVSLLVALLFGIFDGLKVAAASMKSFDVSDATPFSQGLIHFVAWISPVMSELPLYDQGMAWLVPTLVAIVVCIIIGHSTKPSSVNA